MIVRSLRASKLAVLLTGGAIGVIPTDTIYGISCSALNRAAVERVYTVCGRERAKPFIILIAWFDDIALFCDRKIAQYARTKLARIWPAPASIILPCPSTKVAYLHRGGTSLAFRMPSTRALQFLLKKTGPLITTSANPEGKKPATTISQAKKYFGAALDFYVDTGKHTGKPSTLLRLDGDALTVLRQGSYKLYDKQ